MTTNSAPQQQGKRTLKSFFPILDWLPKYQSSWLRVDTIAALTLWALLVPEAMAYAGIAGMPPETGLYAAPLALLAYAVFGTAKQLNVGPSSAVAALSFSVIAGLGFAAGSPEFILLTIALALVVGIMLIIGGFMKLGVLADFLSRPVLDGFIVGVAISIIVGQLDKMLGYAPEKVYDFVPEILLLIRDIGMVHPPTLIVGLISLALLFALHKFTPKLPGALIVLFLAIILSTLFRFEEELGIHIVGEIPAGLPKFGFPDELGWQQLLMVAPGALGVAMVAFAESVAIARAYGTKHGYEVDANQELIAVGAANIGSSFSGAFIVDGSMSRTAAADEAKAKTQMVSIITAVAILITAVALTSLFYNLPEATLGAIVIHAVWKNVNFNRISKYRSITRLDYATAIVALVGVLAFGLLQGLLLAAFLGLVVLLFGTKQRSTSVLGKVPDTNVFRSLEHHPEGETYPGLLILRFDGSLFFANAHDFVTAVRKVIAAADPPPRVILLDGESMNGIDATAVITLKEFQEQLQQKENIELRFASMKTKVLGVMERGGLLNTIPTDHFYPSVHAAVDAYMAER